MLCLHLLNASGELDPYASDLNALARSTFETVRAQLAIEGVDVVLYINPYGVISELGINGYAPDAHTVMMSLDPQNPNFAPSWQREFVPMLAHELHHVARWRGPGYGRSLLEALVSEGLAQQFERGFRGGEAPIYSQALSTDQRSTLARRARAEYDMAPHDHAAWFYGSEAQGLPRWTGYTLGYDLVGRFLAHTQQTAAQAARLPAFAFRETGEICEN